MIVKIISLGFFFIEESLIDWLTPFAFNYYMQLIMMVQCRRLSLKQAVDIILSKYLIKWILLVCVCIHALVKFGVSLLIPEMIYALDFLQVILDSHSGYFSTRNIKFYLTNSPYSVGRECSRRFLTLNETRRQRYQINDKTTEQTTLIVLKRISVLIWFYKKKFIYHPQ